VPRYLADTSAWTRSQATTQIAARWAALVTLDEIATCSPVRLELLYSARGPADYRQRSNELAGLPELPLTEADARAALGTQAALSQRSQHRGPKPMNLFIAAIAQRNDVVLLHYDRHFDAIARVTGQPTEWLARRGSLD
jgi:predicted nucleic acid-binding protein